jgi:uroporphyrinogen III methyltransferase/synthase
MLNTKNGKVYLVGAGPGDPGLITVKGKECIEAADVVIYDYLASPTLLKYAGRNAEIIYVGKKGGDHTLPQEGINELIVEKAKEGLTVTRLKGGDPFIFGRGGEEAEVIIEAGIPFEIVPGVTSAIAAPAYAGIPLTHRKYTSSVSIITGHEDPTKKGSSINWEATANGQGTLVFLMGVKNLPHISQKLIQHGKSPDTPVGVVRWGTTPRQKAVTGTLETIVERVKAAGLKSPSIIIVGDVVQLRDTMKWFENRPLFDKTVVVTRAREQASDLVKRLSDYGAECLEYPMITVVPVDDLEPLNRAIANLSSYTWIVFTSVNGVNFFFDQLYQKGGDARSLGHLRTASIGPATANRLLHFGIKSDIIPKSYRAESIVEAFAKEDIKGKRILLPRAKEARPILPVELRKMGAIVDEINTYGTREVREGSEDLIEKLEKGKIDLITFTSSSTVKNFKALLPPEKFESLIQKTTFASIGPITTETAKDLGFDIHITAATYTIDGLTDAILDFYKNISD